MDIDSASAVVVVVSHITAMSASQPSLFCRGVHGH